MAHEAQLDASDIAELRHRLEAERAELRSEIDAEVSRHDEENHARIADAVRDRGDESVADLYADLGFATIEMQVDRLRAVENALQRMAKGEYGVCIDCGEGIGPARLRADPAVGRCINCQTHAEGPAGGKDRTPSL